MLSFAFAALASAAAAISADELEFSKYIARFNKPYYGKEEFKLRLERFVHNHKIILEHNSSEASFYFLLGLNNFSDWTEEEYLAMQGYNGARFRPHVKGRVLDSNEVFDESDLPKQVDWVKEGAVTPVR